MVEPSDPTRILDIYSRSNGHWMGNQKQMLNQDQDSNNEEDNKSTNGENQDTEPNSKGENANDSSNSEHSILSNVQVKIHKMFSVQAERNKCFVSLEKLTCDTINSFQPKNAESEIDPYSSIAVFSPTEANDQNKEPETDMQKYFMWTRKLK